MNEASEMAETIRSFIAFDVDNNHVLSRLSDVQSRLKETGADLKLVAQGNIHITMRFLGNIHISMVDRIHSAMKQLEYVPFEVEIRGVKAFPNLRRIRVLWAGIQEGFTELQSIFDQLEPRLRKLGFPPDRKQFSSHITIARARTPQKKPELSHCLNELAGYEFGVLKLESLKLKKSVLSPRGPEYSDLKEFSPLC